MQIIQHDNLAAMVATLQQVVDSTGQKAVRDPQVVRQQAEAVGIDPDLAEQVVTRLDKQVLKNVVQKRISQEQVIEALLHVVLLDSEESKTRRRKQWAELRESLRHLGAKLGVALSEIDSVIDETGFGYRPDLHDIAEKISEWMAKNP